MTHRPTSRIVLAAALLLFLTVGCASPEPWQRSAFARPHMAPEADAPARRLRTHVYQSREGTTPLERRLEPRPALHGLVIDGARRPLPESSLLLFRESVGERAFGSGTDRWRSVTDAEGRFAYEALEEGRYSICVLRGPNESDDSALLRRAVVVSGSETIEVTLDLQPPEHVDVRGSITPPGTGAPALVPTFLPHAAEGTWVLARPDGLQRFVAGGLERGAYCVLITPASDDEPGPVALLPHFEVAGLGRQDVELRFPAGRLQGSLVHGRPAELRVVALPRLPAGFARDALASARMLKSLALPVGADGRFEVPNIAAGSWELLVLAPDGAPLARLPFEHAGGLELLPPHRL